MSKRDVAMTGKYLQIPVRMSQNKVPVHFSCEGKKILELGICVGDGDWDTDEFDYYGQIPMSAYLGKNIEIEGDVPEGLLAKINCSDELYKNEEKRPAYHFTPNVGWMNDPNGLVYQDGTYHFYFQHNPVDREWYNMSWGHAVSKDLLHWTYKDIVLLPEEDGTIFSGCAMINERGALGYPKDAILAFYTVAGSQSVWSKDKKHVQKVAVSLDGGETMIPLKEGVLPTIVCYDRDPAVFWHEESQAYVMLLWLDGNDFAFFRSTDLLTWEQSQRITLPKGYECPNIRKLYTKDGAESCWMIFDAAGNCYTGDFDGYQFDWSGKIQNLFHSQETNPHTYAAQLYSGTKDRCILIPWVMTNDIGKKYHCSAGLPRELYMKKEEDGSFTVCQKPVAEYEAAKVSCHAGEATEAEITLNGEENVALMIKAQDGTDLNICYETNGLLIVGEREYRVASDLNWIRVLTDDRIVEIFLEDIDYLVEELTDSACGFEDVEEYEVNYWQVK